MNIVSLFANIGVAEALLHKVSASIVVANELEKRRSDLYSQIYPETNMICGDFTNDKVFKAVLDESILRKADIVIATPPCQGMSTAGQQKPNDDRNKLIMSVLQFIDKLSPKYALIENVPLFLKTKIQYRNQNKLIPELIESKLSSEYIINPKVINTKDYGIPQSRQRAIVLLTRKDQKTVWNIPKKEKEIKTLEDAIGFLPPLDPFVKDISDKELLKLFPNYEKRKKEALRFSRWHSPPKHVKRQVISMMHTPTNKSAFQNKKFYPVKENGEPARGFMNTYKRQSWDAPGYAVTMDNRKISSQNNVHPGRLIGENENGEDVYSDPRALTLYEIMKVMTIPDDWPLPENAPEAFVRRIIGEGVPPLFINKLFKEISKEAQ